MIELELRRTVPAPPARVFARLCDHQGWVRWTGVQEVVVRQPGDPPPGGLGAIRVVRSRGVAVEEEVVVYEPDKRLVLRLVAGLPVREATTDIALGERDGGTEVVWRLRFRAWLPLTGGLLARALRRTVERWLRGLEISLAE